MTNSEIAYQLYFDMMIKELHGHPLIKREDGSLAWECKPGVIEIAERIGINNIVELFESLGFGKNSEVMRKLFRDLGYSLFGYWELFYWEVNNPAASEYVPTQPEPFKFNIYFKK